MISWQEIGVRVDIFHFTPFDCFTYLTTSIQHSLTGSALHSLAQGPYQRASIRAPKMR